ncbi:MAG: hypothetical protein GY854_00255 [Deltaproteobacteria bacterium]|nr:hypothetical protein [Deltaproteobacteria bacterium]
MSKTRKRNKTLFVSDVHMSAGRSLKPGYKRHAYDWLNETEAARFAGFLEQVSKRSDVSELVLLGDIFDNWICPVDEIPPTLGEIVRADQNRATVEQLKILAKHPKIDLVFVPGNHDMSVKTRYLSRYLPGVKFKMKYRNRKILAEHGHNYTLFNAPDRLNAPRTALPLGYFISRVVTTQAANTGTTERHVWGYVDDLLEALGPQKMAASVWEAVLEEANLSDSTQIRMSRKAKISAKTIKRVYADLFDQWTRRVGLGATIRALMAEVGQIGNVADRLCKKRDTNIVIFGHNHRPAVDKDTWFVDDRIYANCGTWVGGKAPTYIEIETAKSKNHVRLYEWHGNSKLIRKETLRA